MASHAGTLLVGRLAVMGFAVVDTVVAGRHSNLSLAALSVGAAVFITVNVSLMGLLSGLLPIWAELHGARKLAAIGPSARQALYLCAMASLLGMAVLFNSGPLLRWTAVPTDLRPVAAQYLAVVGWSLPAALLFRAFSTLNQALGRPQLVSWLQVLALAVKLPLSVWLTFGGAGVPALGVVGCAWATFVVNVLLCVLALGLLRTQSLYAPLRLWQRIERPHGPTLAAFARLGVPAGLTVGVEITSFTLMALFVARLGTTATAAHQIAANVTSLMYMLPLSLAVATSARVGWWRGAGDEARARTVALQGFWLAAASGTALAAIVFVAKPWIAGVYSAHAGVVALAAGLLGWVALLHVADAMQTVAIFVANPNNPTGTLVGREELQAFVEGIPPQVLCVLDEAYLEFLENPADFLPTIRSGARPNLLLMRTFSKIYGLAGLRLGYGVAVPELAATLEKVRQPFNINSLAQAAALAALDDVEHLTATLSTVTLRHP